MTKQILFAESYELLQNPFTGLYIVKDKTNHQKFIKNGWMDEEGNVIITEREFNDEMKKIEMKKKADKPEKGKALIHKTAKDIFIDTSSVKELELQLKALTFELDKAYQEIFLEKAFNEIYIEKERDEKEQDEIETLNKSEEKPVNKKSKGKKSANV